MGQSPCVLGSLLVCGNTLEQLLLANQCMLVVPLPWQKLVLYLSLSRVLVDGALLHLRGAPLMEPRGSSSAVLSEFHLGVGRAGICAPNAMPGIDPAFLEFLVLRVSVLVMV